MPTKQTDNSSTLLEGFLHIMKNQDGTLILITIDPLRGITRHSLGDILTMATVELCVFRGENLGFLRGWRRSGRRKRARKRTAGGPQNDGFLQKMAIFGISMLYFWGVFFLGVRVSMTWKGATAPLGVSNASFLNENRERRASYLEHSTLGFDQHCVVVSKIFYFHPYLGKWWNLTNIFQMGWNHQLEHILDNTLLLIVGSNWTEQYDKMPRGRLAKGQEELDLKYCPPVFSGGFSGIPENKKQLSKTWSLLQLRCLWVCQSTTSSFLFPPHCNEWHDFPATGLFIMISHLQISTILRRENYLPMPNVTHFLWYPFSTLEWIRWWKWFELLDWDDFKSKYWNIHVRWNTWNRSWTKVN